MSGSEASLWGDHTTHPYRLTPRERGSGAISDGVEGQRQSVAAENGITDSDRESAPYPLGRSPSASSRSSSAIRTKTPFLACRKYAARGSGSTSAAISSTRGSGWRTIA